MNDDESCQSSLQLEALAHKQHRSQQTISIEWDLNGNVPLNIYWYYSIGFKHFALSQGA